MNFREYLNEEENIEEMLSEDFGSGFETGLGFWAAMNAIDLAGAAAVLTVGGLALGFKKAKDKFAQFKKDKANKKGLDQLNNQIKELSSYKKVQSAFKTIKDKAELDKAEIKGKRGNNRKEIAKRQEKELKALKKAAIEAQKELITDLRNGDFTPEAKKFIMQLMPSLRNVALKHMDEDINFKEYLREPEMINEEIDLMAQSIAGILGLGIGNTITYFLAKKFIDKNYNPKDWGYINADKEEKKKEKRAKKLLKKFEKLLKSDKEVESAMANYKMAKKGSIKKAHQELLDVLNSKLPTEYKGLLKKVTSDYKNYNITSKNY